MTQGINRIVKIALSMLLLILPVACTAQPFGHEDSTPLPQTLICTVFYRPTTVAEDQARGEEVTIRLARDGDQETAAFADMKFQAQYVDDPFEGRSLLITVLRSDEQVLVRQLYQFIPNVDPNSFGGGHGFTGLTYVYHPATGAEMQYFCRQE